MSTWPRSAKVAGVSVLLLLAGVAGAQERAVQPKPVARSAEAKFYPHLHALCIGINDYTCPGIPDLTYAEAGAREVAQVLRGLDGFDDAKLLLGSRASKAAIDRAIAGLFDANRVGPRDGVVIYFSGHGQTIKQGSSEVGYLIPQDARIALSQADNPAPYRLYALRMDDLRNDADGIPAKHVLFLIDACYGGYLSSKAIEVPPSIVGALRYPARQVITAGTAGEQVVEHNVWGHGAFTYKLLQILRAEPGALLASALGVMIKQCVPREVAARFGPSRSLSPQAKYLAGDGDFVFVRRARPAGVRAQGLGQRLRAPASRPAPVRWRRPGDRSPSRQRVPQSPAPTTLGMGAIYGSLRQRRSQPPGAGGAPISVRVNSFVGVAPRCVAFEVQLPPDLAAGADCLWTDNGKPIGLGLSGRRILREPGLHRIAALVVTRDDRELRTEQVVRVLPRTVGVAK